MVKREIARRGGGKGESVRSGSRLQFLGGNGCARFGAELDEQKGRAYARVLTSTCIVFVECLVQNEVSTAMREMERACPIAMT